MSSRGLEALPNAGLIDFLNGEMSNKFNKFALIGSNGIDDTALKNLLSKTANLTYSQVQNYIFEEGEVESAYFDDEGVFTSIVNLTNEDGYNKHLYAVGLFSDDRIVGTIANTPIIYLTSQIGGQFPIKIPIKGNEGDVVFRSTEYLPEAEAEERFLTPLVQMFAMNTNIYISQIERELKEMGEK